MTDFPDISDGVVRILPFNAGHLSERYIAWLNDREVVQYSEQRHRAHTLETANEYFDRQSSSDDCFLAIELVGDIPIHIGNLGVSVNQENKTSDVSIMIGDKDHWGTGAASRAWTLALDTLLGKLGFRLVTAGTMEVNEPMIRLMERSGMTIDCVLPKRFIWNGREVGMVCASKPSIQNGI